MLLLFNTITDQCLLLITCKQVVCSSMLLKTSHETDGKAVTRKRSGIASSFCFFKAIIIKLITY